MQYLHLINYGAIYCQNYHFRQCKFSTKYQMVCGIENTTILTGFKSEYMYTLNLSEFLHTEIVLTCLPSFANEAFI